MKIYIIPGLGENCNLVRYKKLIKSLRKDGNDIVPVNPDWYKPLSEIVFKVEPESIVFGFSFGAVLAYLISNKYPHKKTIFASLSPIHKFSFKDLRDDYMLHMDENNAIKLARDIKNIKISLDKLKNDFINIAGQYEDELLKDKRNTIDFIVPETSHFINDKYIKAIKKLID